MFHTHVQVLYIFPMKMLKLIFKLILNNTLLLLRTLIGPVSNTCSSTDFLFPFVSKNFIRIERYMQAGWKQLTPYTVPIYKLTCLKYTITFIIHKVSVGAQTQSDHTVAKIKYFGFNLSNVNSLANLSRNHLRGSNSGRQLHVWFYLRM